MKQRPPIRQGTFEGESVVFIPLNTGEEAIADIDMLSTLMRYRWHSVKGYVVAFLRGKCVRMHRIVLADDASPEIDHKNRNKLDNRRSNLRPATRSQNAFNFGMLPTNTSGMRGVCWHKRSKKWIAQSRLNGRIIHLGYYEKMEEAQAAYWRFNKEKRGEFANFQGEPR